MARIYRPGKKKRSTADVDITPLIDVMFMLILFLLVTAAFVQGSLDVSLPQSGGTPPPLSDKRQIVLTITKNSEVLWAGKSVSSADLLLRVEEALLESADILLAGDKDARYGDVAELMDLLRQSGVPSVGLAFGNGGSGK